MTILNMVAGFKGSNFETLIISILATMAFTFFSILMSYQYRSNFNEPSLLGKVIGFHLKDAPQWLNLTLGIIVHFVVGFLFTAIHLFLYRLLTPVWYNAVFLGFLNGLVAAAIWYTVIKIYHDVIYPKLPAYLIQLVLGHLIFGLVIVFMYLPGMRSSL